MGIISGENVNRLFWLGRYTERVYTTIRMFSVNYDTMIDLDSEECRESSRRYCFDETDENSVYSSLIKAYDNAIVLREEIGSETLAYIQLAMYDMKKASQSDAPLIELQSVMDNLAAFWGIADDRIDKQHVRNLIKVGKRLERIDLYSRMHVDKCELQREAARLTHRIPRTGLHYDETKLQRLNELISQDTPDYEKIVESVENFLDI